MYKSSEYYAAIADGAVFTLSGTLTGTTNTYTITNSDIMMGGFQIDEALSDNGGLTIGGIITSQLKITLNNHENKFNSAELTEEAILSLTLSFDDYDIALPDYHVVDKQTADSVIILTCMDVTDLLNRALDINTTIASNATYLSIVNDICTRFGLTASFDATSEDKLDVAATGFLPNLAGDTYKSLLLYCTQCANVYARISSGKDIYFFFPDPQADSIPIASIRSLEIEEAHSPTFVGVHLYDTDTMVSAGTPGYNLILDSYPLININPNPYLAEFSPLTFRNFALDTWGDPSVQIGDYITVDSKQCLVTTKSYKLGGAMSLGFHWTTDDISDFQQKQYIDPTQDVGDARKVATNYIATDSTGLMVADMENGAETPSTATTRNVLIDSDSVDIRNGQDVLASFGEVTVLGVEGTPQFLIKNNELSGLNKDAAKLLAIDLDGAYMKYSVYNTSIDNPIIMTIEEGQEIPYPSFKMEIDIPIDFDENELVTCDLGKIPFSSADSSEKKIFWGTNTANFNNNNGHVTSGISLLCHDSSGDSFITLDLVAHIDTSSHKIEITFNNANAGKIANIKYELVIGSFHYYRLIKTPFFSFGMNESSKKYPYSCLIGQNLEAASAYQTIIGKYNVTDQNAAFIVANGNEIDGGYNLLTVKNNGIGTIIRGGCTIGTGLQEPKKNQIVIGTCNEEDSDAVFIVAKGTETTPKNIFTVKRTGDILMPHGTLHTGESLWYKDDLAAINLHNSDIVNFNGLYAADAATSLSEGINWKNADGQDPQTWDSIWAKGGKFYFAPASGAAKEIAHADNIYQLYAFPNGTHSVRALGIAYSAGTSGEIYVFPNFPRPLPTGKTITLTALTDVTIRGAGKVQVNNETLTSKVKSATRYYNGQFNIQLQNVTTNWSANQVMFFVGTCAFTIS